MSAMKPLIELTIVKAIDGQRHRPTEGSRDNAPGHMHSQHFGIIHKWLAHPCRGQISTLLRHCQTPPRHAFYLRLLSSWHGRWTHPCFQIQCQSALFHPEHCSLRGGLGLGSRTECAKGRVGSVDQTFNVAACMSDLREARPLTATLRRGSCSRCAHLGVAVAPRTGSRTHATLPPCATSPCIDSPRHHVIRHGPSWRARLRRPS